MIREIIVPTGNTLTLELPDSFVGKEIEVLAFEVPAARPPTTTQVSEDELARRIAEIRAIVAPHRVDLSNFKFDRDEANNYDE